MPLYLRLFETTQMAKAPIQKIFDYITSVFVPVVVVLAFVAWLGWYLAGVLGAYPKEWLLPASNHFVFCTHVCYLSSSHCFSLCVGACHSNSCNGSNRCWSHSWSAYQRRGCFGTCPENLVCCL